MHGKGLISPENIKVCTGSDYCKGGYLVRE